MGRLYAYKLYGLLQKAEDITACELTERRLRGRRSRWTGDFEDGTGTKCLIREDKLKSVITFTKKLKEE
jgi:hypothetical protein